MIYQLAKTSPYLSGQVRLDMCVEQTSVHSVVDSLHVAPLYNITTWCQDKDYRDIDHSHADNVKRLYNGIKEVFFLNLRNHYTDYVIYNEGHRQDPFDHTYEMGVRRERYSRYNKQFSFLCPVWISENIDYNKLDFLFTVEDADLPSSSTNRRRRTKNVQSVVKLGSNMVRYLSEYMSDVDDNLLSIKLDPATAYITGLQVDGAKISTRDVSYIIENLIARERPMMEFDNTLLSLFRLNKIVAHQLLNLNFLFNIEDVFGRLVGKTLTGRDINIKCQVRYDGKIVPIKDLYSNYTNIPAYNIENGTYDRSINVLDYLRDNRAVELANVNKITQPIFHWSLLSDNSQIYNMYDGFGPYFRDERSGEVHQAQGLFYQQGNLSMSEWNVLENTPNWCRHYDMDRSDRAIEILTSVEYSTMTVKIPIAWMNNNKYNFSDHLPLSVGDYSIGDGYELNINTVTYISSSQVPNTNTLRIDPLYVVFANITSRSCKISLMSTDPNNLTLKSVSDIIRAYIDRLGDDALSIGVDRLSILKLIVSMMDSWETPFKILIQKSLIPQSLVLDNRYSSMVYYKESENANIYLYRYVGNLIPSFVDLDDSERYSVSFYLKQFGDNNDEINFSEYNRLLKVGYIPKYYERDNQSQEYRISDDSFYIYRECKFESRHNKWYDDWTGDRTWLNDSKMWVLPTDISIETSLQSSTENYEEEFWNILYERIFTLIPRLDSDWTRKWLRTVYHLTEIKQEYLSDTDISNIRCFVKFQLI